MKKLLVVFLFLSTIAFAQEAVKADLSNPRATIYSHLYFLMPDSYKPDEAAKTFHGLSHKKAVEEAIKLKQILDGKGLLVDINKIPNDPNFVDSIVNPLKSLDKAKQMYVPFPSELPLVYVEKIGRNWYYSKETVDNLDAIYNDVFPWRLNWVQEKFPKLKTHKIFSVELWKIIGGTILIIASILVFFLLRPILFFIVRKIQRLILKDKNKFDDKLIKSLVRSIVLLLVVQFIKKTLPSLQLVDLNIYLFLGLRIAETIFWVFILLNLMEMVMLYFNKFSKRTHSKLDEQLSPILKKILFGFVYFLGFLKLLTIFGVDPKTVLAGASIGGIAFAFAAQDSVKNLIGTVVIFLDKPFHIGDWIEIGSVIGVVEKVGLRSTRVRAADTSVFQIPNSKVTEVEVNNKGLRQFRRYNTELGIRYDTPPELIEAFVEGIRKIVDLHPDTRSESYNVEFSGFGDSALLILVNVYFKALDWGIEQSSKHRLHMAIVKLAAALNVEFAFPSTTVMIEQFPEKENPIIKYDTNKENIKKKIDVVIEEFKNSKQEYHESAPLNPSFRK